MPILGSRYRHVREGRILATSLPDRNGLLLLPAMANAFLNALATPLPKPLLAAEEIILTNGQRFRFFYVIISGSPQLCPKPRCFRKRTNSEGGRCPVPHLKIRHKPQSMAANRITLTTVRTRRVVKESGTIGPGRNVSLSCHLPKAFEG
jgi:hypothetical protein